MTKTDLGFIIVTLINAWQAVKLAELAAKSDRRRASDRHPSASSSSSDHPR